MDKYRAWHKKEQKYYRVKEIDFLYKIVVLMTMLVCKFDEVVLEPYIKLNDKNGREIYKGDILRTKNAVTIVGEPSWFNNCFGYDFEIAGGKNFIDKCRVVGNVHEDKVLL